MDRCPAWQNLKAPRDPAAVIPPGGRRRTPWLRRIDTIPWVAGSIDHDLDAVARLDLGVGVEAVEDAEAFCRTIDAGHAM